MKKTVIPPGVKEAILQKVAATRKGKKGIHAEAAKHFNMTESQVQQLCERNSEKIGDLRAKLSDTYLLLAGQMAGELSKAMSDPLRMAEMPPRDMAQAIEKLTNAAVTAADGHAPKVQINFGEIRQRKANIEQMDRARRIPAGLGMG